MCEMSAESYLTGIKACQSSLEVYVACHTEGCDVSIKETTVEDKYVVGSMPRRALNCTCAGIM